MSQQNVDLVKSAYDFFGSGDIPGLLTTFDPNIEWVSPAGQYRLGGVHKGPDAIVQNFFMVLGELWETLEVIPHESIDNGDRVIVIGTIRGKGRATGKTVESAYVHIFELKDGKIARFEEFEDTATNNEAVRAVASSVS